MVVTVGYLLLSDGQICLVLMYLIYNEIAGPNVTEITLNYMLCYCSGTSKAQKATFYLLLLMGVCALQHRVVTGKYTSVFVVKSTGGCRENYDVAFMESLTAITGILGVLLYCYFLCFLLTLIIETSFKQGTLSYNFTKSTIDLNNMLEAILNNCFLILILHLLKTTKNTNPLKQIKTVFCINIKKYLYFFYSRAAQYTYWVAFLNLYLIVICNPVILNPGPTQGNPKLSVFFRHR